jgi:hypothetical protein
VAFHGMLAPGAAAATTGASPRNDQQLALLDPPRQPPQSRSLAPTLAFRCPRCDRTMEIVGVEPALSPRAA